MFCQGDRFGDTSDTGCKDKPWQFTADFNCPFGENTKIVPMGEVIGWGGAVGTSVYGIDWDYIDSNFQTTADYVCLVQPKVHLLDNWGWCTGSCDYPDTSSITGVDGNVYGDGCYGEDGERSCDERKDDDKPWIKYDGYVVIVPLE